MLLKKPVMTFLCPSTSSLLSPGTKHDWKACWSKASPAVFISWLAVQHWWWWFMLVTAWLLQSSLRELLLARLQLGPEWTLRTPAGYQVFGHAFIKLMAYLFLLYYIHIQSLHGMVYFQMLSFCTCCFSFSTNNNFIWNTNKGCWHSLLACRGDLYALKV